MPQRKPRNVHLRKMRRVLNEPIELALIELGPKGVRELRHLEVGNPEKPMHGKEPVRTFKHLQWLLHQESFAKHPLRHKVSQALEAHLSRSDL